MFPVFIYSPYSISMLCLCWLFPYHLLSQGKMYVFSIGVNEYRIAKYKLAFAKPDAESIVNQIQTLNPQANLTLLLDRNVTKPSILRIIDSLSQLVQPNDAFIFYYAGQGTPGDEDGNKNEYFLIPSDVTRMDDANQQLEKGISMKELTGFSSQLKTKQQLWVLDASNSGLAVDFFSKIGVSIFTSCTAEQECAEILELKHGFFTALFLEAIQKAKETGSNQVSIASTQKYLTFEVQNWMKKYNITTQTPIIFFSGINFTIGKSTN